jgi:polyhydroxyalkanoate synthesis repressor PhaR
MPNERPTVIKKYANRRLYHTGTSTYVTLEDLAAMVKKGEEFVVQDAKTSEDITRAVLGQIIFEHEGRGQHLLPIAFLRQLIRFYGNSVQAILPTYLESALSAFTRDQEKLREQMSKAFQGDAFGLVEEQTRRNMELFSEAMRLWIPFKNTDPARNSDAARPDAARTGKNSAGSEDEIAALRRQLQEMQKTLENLDKGT